MATALRESVLFESAPQIDEAAGIVKHVKVLGRESRNGRTYSDRALKEAAGHYRNAQVNLDHPDKSKAGTDRKVKEQFGWLTNSVVESDGVYADLHYLTKHDFAPRFVELAKRNPTQLGFSHNAEGRTERHNGKTVVESVERVRSVDLVSRPATTNGIFESETMSKTVLEIVKSCSLPGRAAVLKLFEEDGPMATMAEQPVEAPAEVDSESEVKAAFGKMIMAAFEDDSLDMKATLAKIKDILKAHEKLTGKAEAPASDVADDDSEPAKESHVELNSRLRALESERDELKREKSARALIESLGREPSETLVKAVGLLPSEAERKALIESLPKRDAKALGQKPARSAPLVESEKVRPVTNPKEFAASLR